MKKLRKLLKPAWWSAKLRSNRMSDWLYASNELRILAVDRNVLTSAPLSLDFKKNELEQFQNFAEVEYWHDYDTNLRAAQRGLARGENCYTLVENKVLLAVGWMNSSKPGATFDDVDQFIDFGALNVATLYSAYVHPQGRRRGIYLELLQARARDAFDLQGVDFLLCAEDASNPAAVKAHRRIGFETVAIFSKRRVLGRTSYRCEHTPNRLALSLEILGHNQWRLSRAEPCT